MTWLVLPLAMSNTRVTIILLHVLAWTLYIVLYCTLWRDSGDSFGEAIIINLWQLPPKLFLVYTALGILVPQFLRKRRYSIFLISLVALSVIGGILNQVLIHLVVPANLELMDAGETFWDVERVSKRMTYINSPLLFALTVEGIKMWYEQKEINTRLTKEKLAAELALLKGQLQPHFFFNTLNNLYSLTLQRSDLAPALILRLSNMMRYILDDSRKDLVLLADEVEFIRGYIGIEQVRYEGKVKIDTQWPENVDGYRIPPLTLFTFVENAFKHGVAQEMDTAWISIALSLKDNSISFVVKNSRPEIKNGRVAQKSAGIGLRNTKERLEIIYGPAVKFETRGSGETFQASFEIKTARV